MARRGGLRDTFEEIFGDDPDPKDERYPGSTKKRREKPPSATYVSNESWRDVYTRKIIGGKERRFYTVGALAVACGVSTHSVKLWTESGYLPKAPYRLPDMVQGDGTVKPGRKLYTAAMVEAVVTALDKRGFLGAKKIPWKQNPDLTMEILRSWEQIKAREDGLSAV